MSERACICTYIRTCMHVLCVMCVCVCVCSKYLPLLVSLSGFKRSNMNGFINKNKTKHTILITK